MAGKGGPALIADSILREFVTQIFQKAGMPEDDAALTADCLVFADLRGTETHGVSRVNTLVRKLEARVIKAKPDVRIVKKQGATLVVDGDDAMGQVAAGFAMKRAIETAAGSGVSMVGVVNGGHIGALAYWSMMALPHGMIGFSTSNGTPVLAPWGSKQAMISNMPIAIAAPAGKRFPLVLDMALSVAARGNIILAEKKGESIPLGWAMDQEGQPTQDPKEALKGSVLPIGGYKGSGLAIMIEVLTAVLLGGKFGKDCGFMAPENLILAKTMGFNNLMMALRIENFTPIEAFQERMDTLIDLLKSAPLAKGVDAILMPGEKEFRMEQKRKKEGIPLGEVTVRELNQLAEKFGLQSPFHRSPKSIGLG
jgi:LDH2 family malate/lactate/ureidoglycolate dehydrogenase